MNPSRTKVENVAVTTAFEMTFAGSESDDPIAATLKYNVFEPFAVTASFVLGEGPAVQWVMSRDLLREGVVMPTGLGDIRVYPVSDTLYMELASPSGRAILEAPIAPVIEFIGSVFATVPEGAEGDYFSVDAELDMLSELYAQRDGDAAA
ncbi:SsgA family sporulation/cell division regulator [Nakamurella deserti]|uniref:SsgA family sporulation/cell division regulator n=1 Tax=Nakamurella deserti TaxID=2164074 RepID=UPI001300656A|nr:SsgA family sporulation/cell division regulator [Nakamurella deserti]